MANVIHMEPSQVQQLNQQLMAANDAIKLEANNTMNRCSAHVGTDWIASGATEFQSQVSQQNAQLMKLCGALEELYQRLPREIAQWEDAQRTSRS